MDLFDLTGKQALVTGAGSPRGLARAMARGLQEAGARVAILDLSDDVFRVAREDGFIPVQADLTQRTDLKQGFAEAVAKLGSLDILLNGHGIQRRIKSEEFPIEVWDLVLEVNLTSVFELCQLVAQIMLQKGFGKIINVASMQTFSGGITIPAYAASKGGDRSAHKGPGQRLGRPRRQRERHRARLYGYRDDQTPHGRRGA